MRTFHTPASQQFSIRREGESCWYFWSVINSFVFIKMTNRSDVSFLLSLSKIYMIVLVVGESFSTFLSSKQTKENKNGSDFIFCFYCCRCRDSIVHQRESNVTKRNREPFVALTTKPMPPDVICCEHNVPITK